VTQAVALTMTESFSRGTRLNVSYAGHFRRLQSPNPLGGVRERPQVGRLGVETLASTRKRKCRRLRGTINRDPITRSFSRSRIAVTAQNASREAKPVCWDAAGGTG